MRKRIYLIVSCIVACLAIATLGVWEVMSRRALLYEIPGGYKGWIFIQFEDPACPPLAVKGIFHVVKVSLNGRACTSGSHPEGIYYARFEYIYPDGTRRNLPWSTSSNGNALVRLLTYDPTDKSEVDFVGNKEEFMHAGPPPYRWRHSNATSP